MGYQSLSIMSRILSPNILDKSGVVNLIEGEQKPVVFWDTCSLLDILRIPLPDRGHSTDVLKRIIEIKSKIVSGDIMSLSSELCIKEFDDHVEQCLQDIENAAKKLSRSFNIFAGFINEIPIVVPEISPVDLSMYKINNALIRIVHSIIDKTVFVREDTTFLASAHFRTTYKIPPAKKKGEYKDCYIWATCLDVRKESIGRNYSYIFLSSNSVDYADDSKTEFADELKNETQSAEITYCSNFQIAYKVLKEKGVF
jgi:hypothetical protein